MKFNIAKSVFSKNAHIHSKVWANGQREAKGKNKCHQSAKFMVQFASLGDLENSRFRQCILFCSYSFIGGMQEVSVCMLGCLRATQKRDYNQKWQFGIMIQGLNGWCRKTTMVTKKCSFYDGITCKPSGACD